ncbi:MAG: hypothetical protein C4525_14260 [Desulfarculus sp.]|nr:MAG: hypothetical protein C4525_14260 [Desulfarculus sp.]
MHPSFSAHPAPRPAPRRAVWLLWPLASLAVAALALMSLGSFGQALRYDESPSLSVAPTQSVAVRLEALPLTVRGLRVSVFCAQGGCGGLTLWFSGIPVEALHRDGGRAEFRVTSSGAMDNSLRVANLSSQPVRINGLRVQNYQGVNNNFPRLVLLLGEPLVRELTARSWLGPVLLALLAQVLAALFWRGGRAGFWWGWRTWAWLLPPLAGLAAAFTARVLDLRLLLAWDAYLLLVCVGPLALGLATLWGGRGRSRWLGTLLTYGTLIAAFLAVSGLALYAESQQRGSGQPTALIDLGRHFAKDPRWVPQGAVLRPEAFGYDGQFFLYMAQDPWARQGAWANIDSPAYRYQRMLYPLLLNLLSGGDKDRLPNLMLVFNLACLLAAFLIMCRLAARLGAALPWALFFLCAYGLFQPVWLGLSEPLANLLLAWGLYAITAGALWWASLALVLMVLTKEHYAVAPALAAAWCWLLSRRGLLAYLLPLAAGLAWQLWLWQRFGHPAFEQSNAGNFTWPLLGSLGLLLSPIHGREVFLGLGFLALLGLTALLLWRGWQRLDLWLLAGLLLVPLFGGESIWGHSFSYHRVLAPAYLAYLAVLFKERSLLASVPGALFGCQAALSLLQV